MRVLVLGLLRKRRLFLVLFGMALATSGVAPRPVRADGPSSGSDTDAAARSAFEAGRQAYDHGAFAEALAHHERAYALSRRAELLFNIGRAADSDGQPGRAIAAYSSYLDAFPGAENGDFVRARLEKMRALERSGSAAQASPLPTVASAMPAEHGAPLADSSAALPARDGDPPRPFWKRVWFWSVVGAVVVGGVTAGAIAATRAQDPTRSAADQYVFTPVLR